MHAGSDPMSEVQLAPWAHSQNPQRKEIDLSCASTLIGAMLFIGRRLKVLGFAYSAERLVTLLLTLLALRTLFAQIERLMQQMEEGKLKAID